MEADASKHCCGCLSSGRKMKLLRDSWSDRSYHNISNIIQIPINTYALWLCWECKARISNFLIYKEQMQISCKILEEYFRKENHKTKLQSSSNLRVCYQTSIEICLNNSENEIKEENSQNLNDDDDVNIKNETEYYSDDNKSLIHLQSEKKLPKKKKDKKKETNIKKVKKKMKDDVLYEKIILTPEEVAKEQMIMKSDEDFVNAMFKCEKCIIPFANSDDLDEHTVKKHTQNASKHTCSVCERTFPTEHSCAAHARSHSLRYQCCACAHRARTERAARAHVRAAHGGGDTEMYELAAKAYKVSDEKQNLEENNRPKSEEQYPCEYCEKIFRWKTSLRKHMETHKIEAGHKKKPYCETCRLSFTTTSNLRKHVKTSSKHQIKLKMRKLKDLPNSSDALHQSEDLQLISSRINGARSQYPCPQCEARFQWRGNLLRHLRSHAARANGDLVCEPCNRTFSSIATYKQHMKISRKHVSDNEFKYMCSDCGKRFSNKVKLKDHIDWEHLKNYTHACSECQKVFKSHTSLYLHRQVVHRLCNSEHLCDHCGKSFANKTKLRSHIIALHTRDSPYKCDTCSARFSWHSCLSRHVKRVHKIVLKKNV